MGLQGRRCGTEQGSANLLLEASLGHANSKLKFRDFKSLEESSHQQPGPVFSDTWFHVDHQV